MEWSILHFKGLSVQISKKYVFLFLKIFLILENSAEPAEKLLYASFHLGLHCLPKCFACNLNKSVNEPITNAADDKIYEFSELSPDFEGFYLCEPCWFLHLSC